MKAIFKYKIIWYVCKGSGTVIGDESPKYSDETQRILCDESWRCAPAMTCNNWVTRSINFLNFIYWLFFKKRQFSIIFQFHSQYNNFWHINKKRKQKINKISIVNRFYAVFLAARTLIFFIFASRLMAFLRVTIKPLEMKVRIEISYAYFFWNIWAKPLVRPNCCTIDCGGLILQKIVNISFTSARRVSDGTYFSPKKGHFHSASPKVDKLNYLHN